MNKKKVVKIILAIALLTTAIVTTVFIIRKTSDNQNTVPTEAYVTTIEDIQKTEISSFSGNRFSGTAESEDELKVTADADKIIKTTYVKKGDTVKKGDKLFEYDTDSMQLELDKSTLEAEELTLQIKTTKNTISSLEKELANAKKADEKLTIENNITTTKIELKKTEYSLQSTEKEVAKLKKSLENNVVRAKKDGKVTAVNDRTANTATNITANVPQSLADTGNINSENVYITITTGTNFKIKTLISETHIDEFTKGTKVTVRSRKDITVTWNGKVDSIGNAIISSPSSYETQAEKVTRYPVYITLDKQDGIKAGQHFTVETGNSIVFHKNIVELKGYYLNDIDTSPYVWGIGADGKLKKCSVKLGNYDAENDLYEITSGITVKDYIAYPESFLTEGMAVIKTDAD